MNDKIRYEIFHILNCRCEIKINKLKFLILTVINAIFATAYGSLKNSGLQQGLNPHRLIRTHKWLICIVSGFMAQLARASHWYHEIKGSNSIEVLNFSGFHTQLQNNCVHNSKEHSLFYLLLLLWNLKCHWLWNNNIRNWAPSSLAKQQKSWWKGSEWQGCLILHLL